MRRELKEVIDQYSTWELPLRERWREGLLREVEFDGKAEEDEFLEALVRLDGELDRSKDS